MTQYTLITISYGSISRMERGESVHHTFVKDGKVLARAKSKQEKDFERMRQHEERVKVWNALLDCSYHDHLIAETVFWQHGIPAIKERLAGDLGYVPQYAVDVDRCGEVLSVGWRLK